MVVDTLIRDALKDLQFELGLLELFQESSFIFVILHLLRCDFPEVRQDDEGDDCGDTPATQGAHDEPPVGVASSLVGAPGGDAAHDHADEYDKF
jgi:hypothetical protein